MSRAAIFAFAVSAMIAGPVQAQDQTLADIRQELTVLSVAVQSLTRELSTTGGASIAVGGDTLQRVDLIEQELSRLTAKTEELEFRIGQVVSDGTNRIGDLEFRLCELEPNCDIGALGTTSTLGGGTATVAAVQPPARDTATQLAVGEQADFDRARSALDAGSFRSAADLFATFSQTYTGGPLTGEAHFLRGEALTTLGESKEAGRAYLASFNSQPTGPRAADALLGLGNALGALGQLAEACVTLDQVRVRFPGSALIGQAQTDRQRLGCS